MPGKQGENERVLNLVASQAGVTVSNARRLATELLHAIQALPTRNTPSVRRLRRACSRRLASEPAAFVLQVADAILASGQHRWVAYELIRDHQQAFLSLEEARIESLGRGIDSWSTVDSFARTISGPAWLAGLVSDAQIMAWAGSPDRWWRRAALVSTVALNVRSHGGSGDVKRTLGICRRLAHDHDDMVAKALSWALRELVVHDPRAVRAFLGEHRHMLAARVKREVLNKLTTGLKSPSRRSDPD